MRDRYRAHSRRGFTLIEMIVVLAIISVLVSVVGVGSYSYVQRSRVVSTRLNMKNLETALMAYLTDNGDVPNRRQGLEALVRKTSVPPVPENFLEGGYLDGLQVPRDGWDRDFAYIVPGPEGKPFMLVSYGKDGEEGGTGYDADLTNFD